MAAGLRHLASLPRDGNPALIEAAAIVVVEWILIMDSMVCSQPALSNPSDSGANIGRYELYHHYV